MYASEIDIWAVGCILAEMTNLEPIFMGDSEIDQIMKVFRCLGTPTDKEYDKI